MDRLLINDLCLDATVGVYSHEQTRKQPVRFDLELAIDVAHAAATDELVNALDYEAVARAIAQLVQQQAFALIETLAERCAQLLLDQFPITGLKLTLYKPGALPGKACVAVQIERP